MHLKAILCTSAFALNVAFTSSPALSAEKTGETILILDASGSMWGKVGDKVKIEVARDAVGNMLATWPASEALGFMAYGHRRKGDCGDIELLSAPTLIDPVAFKKQVNSLQPKGMTPISASVRQAADVLKFTEQKATIILVSDGEETCNADPCALGAELETAGVDFTAHVVGFDLREGKARAQLQCLAKNTGGRYVEARDAAELNKALGEIAQAPVASAGAEQVKDPLPPKGCRLFDGENLTGESIEIGASGYADEMPAGWDNRVRSGQCSKRAGLTLYFDRAREGDSEWISEGETKAKLSGEGSSYIFVGTYGEAEDGYE
jgi:hypothetical protein